jgi:hypothetical protein
MPLIILIILPFAALIIAILTVSIMRGIRRATELRSREQPLIVSSDHRRPSDDFHDQTWLPLCTKIAQEASARLGRRLTEKERRTIWRGRSPLTLQVAIEELASAPNPDAITLVLAKLPSGMDRPDPTGWCNKTDP